MVLKSAERLMYEVEGARVAVIGHTIAGCAISTSVLITTVCTADTRLIAFMSIIGAVLV